MSGTTVVLVDVSWTEGKGVIYRMIDEWNNDCPYDFKNIFYETIYFAKLQKYGSFYKSSLRRVPNNDTELDGEPLFAWEATTIEGPNGTDTGYSLDESLSDATLYSISNGNLEVHSTIKDVNVQKGQYTFGQNDDNSLYGGCNNNTIKFIFMSGISTLPRILFYDNCSNNSFGYNCHNNSFGNNCSDNSFGNNCSNNRFCNNCFNNSLGNGCNNVELSEITSNQTAFLNSNYDVIMVNLGDLVDLLNK